jgi:hypothetical protein
MAGITTGRIATLGDPIAEQHGTPSYGTFPC